MTDEDLSAFPARAFESGQVLYRIHKSINDPLFFRNLTGTDLDCRFDIRREVGAGTCYTGLTPIASFLETLGRTRHLTEEKIDERSLACMVLKRAIRCADLTDRSIIGRFGIAGDLSAGSDYGPSQRWAERFLEAAFDGIFYTTRHDPALNQRSIAVFGDSESADELFEAESDQIPQYLVDEACRDYGFTVWPSTPTLRP